MALLAFIAIFALDVPFPYIVLAAGIIGYAGSHFVPEKFRAGGHHAESDKDYGPALIDDDTPVPEHARFKWAENRLNSEEVVRTKRNPDFAVTAEPARNANFSLAITNTGPTTSSGRFELVIGGKLENDIQTRLRRSER